MVTTSMVCELIAKKLGSKAGAHTLDAETRFDAVGLSSLQIADIVYEIEDEVGIEFDPGRAADVKSVGDLVALANATRSDGVEA
ncbi:acyl carrier protein [Streptomyces lonarensis]|uniref:Acyl carrier protein n=1 Tax=Streptomyces lonarensis TaxID=700599 RepID=A0A7X6I0H8_9ACTN|nr:acyl carrier protein [Streptomyces lonarensis]NJQ07289.1 acyl carrier protein [Streptomyces lonarensis]